MKHKILNSLVFCSFFCGFGMGLLARPAQAERLVISDNARNTTGQSQPAGQRPRALIIKDNPYKPDKYGILAPSDLPIGKGYPEEDNRKTDAACLNPSMSPAALWISPGDVLGEKLQAWAKSYGYELLWEGNDLKAMGRLQSDKGLTDTLADIKQAMEQNGINLEITTYTNCVVRVVEVQDE